ncbi:hypothetical protein [Burkholderia glumae]|uniref:hypothetical protein n=1 Tax=Burkholderia glumae TaxID=337 RepID=UPI003B9AA3B4
MLLELSVSASSAALIVRDPVPVPALALTRHESSHAAVFSALAQTSVGATVWLWAAVRRFASVRARTGE